MEKGKWLKRVSTLIAVMIVSIAWAFPAMSQTHYVPRVSVGAHAGMTLGEMGFSPSVRQSFVSGFTFGGSFRWAEERHVGLVAELNFAQRGWAENFEDKPFSYKRQLTYIEIPIMTHIFFGSRRFNGFFNLGPQIGYMIGDKITADFDYSNVNSIPNFPGNRQTEQLSAEIKNRFDYGITAGAGIEFYISPKNSIQIQGRYYYGLGNIFPSSKKDTFSASRGSMISITAAYIFRIR